MVMFPNVLDMVNQPYQVSRRCAGTGEIWPELSAPSHEALVDVH